MVTLPKGISLGQNIVALPMLHSVFDFPLWRQPSHRVPTCIKQPLSWVKRGETICVLNVYFRPIRRNLASSFLRSFELISYEKFPVKSPVSGLVIHDSNLSHGGLKLSSDDREDNYARVLILTPKDEPAPENGDFMFGNLCDMSWTTRERFLKAGLIEDNPRWVSERDKNPQYSDERLEAYIKESLKDQKSRMCKVLDWTEERDRIDHIRKYNYEARSALSHLL